MRLCMLPEAEDEIQVAFHRYAEEREELGIDFADAAQTAMEDVLRDPERFAFVEKVREVKGVQRHSLRRFPYEVIYKVFAEEILVVAVAHFHRRPGYWKGRLSTP